MWAETRKGAKQNVERGPAVFQSRIIGVALAVTCCPLLAALGQTPAPPAAGPPLTRPSLPGLQGDGAVLLPNQWSLRPAGRQLELGDFPVHIALHPGGRWLAVLHAGYGDHEVVVVDLKRQRVASRVVLEQAFYGLCFAPDGRRLYASGGQHDVVHSFAFDDGLLSAHDRLPVSPGKETFFPGGVAVDPGGRTLYAAGVFGHAVAVVPLDDPGQRSHVALPADSYPYSCVPERDGRRLFVSLWNGAAVAVLDPTARRITATWATEKHPTEMALSPDGKTLFVACANSTRVCVLDTATGKSLETIACSLYPSAPAGNTPNSLCLTPDGSLLFVANADANNLAVFNVSTPGSARALGFIPVGWYPTSVCFNPADKRLYVANGKGATPKANRDGPNPNRPRGAPTTGYIAGLYRGTLEVIDLPTPERMAAYTRDAYACSPLRRDLGVSDAAPAESPIPPKVGGASPIKHVIYIIKENRTYDQVFGDMKEGNGDPSLCLFPEAVTPNHHRLAREFVLLDNFYVDGEVSADGHEWSMAAYATDFVEKMWPLSYRPAPVKKVPYPAEGNLDAVARPAGGYLWDRCAEARVSYRSYGEWVQDGKTPKDPGRAKVKALEAHFDPWFRGFDLDYSDQLRADRFIAELARFEKEGDMPGLVIMRLPNDHTSGTRPRKPTPTASVADNDLALGRVVEAVSGSTFWKDTVIFVVEDDAQNGPDHVDAHRTVALVISPYARRGVVDSGMYSTSSMLRTIELILGLKPMSQFDAAARPMYGSFQSRADLRPYRHAVPKADLNEKNRPDTWGAAISERLDLSKEDAADCRLLNEVIWHSVRGPRSAVPPPVRAAFVVARPDKSRDDDD
jgi:DNA-binding beta-propeller fold protein YncE